MKPKALPGATAPRQSTAARPTVAKSQRTATAGKKSAPKKQSIFVYDPRHQKEVASDVIRADCTNHGYMLDKTVGEGAYAKVKLAEVLPAKLARNQTLADIAEETGNLQVAIKVIDNRRVPKEFLRKFLPRELANHVPLPHHKSVARVFEQFRTTERVYVVMEYCSKGDLLDLINQRITENHRGVGEDKARAMFRQMCEGIQHIHNNGIVHRDLKCENILIDEHGDIKVTDFGFSTKFDEKAALLRTSCGSYAYTAPEVIKSKPYDGFKSDTWSLGIILFAMLNGRLPFNDSQLMEMEEDMKMQRLRFERIVSFDAMVLVRRVLQYNPAQRPTVYDILNDPWVSGKMMIPRQINRPKWINPYEAKPDEHRDNVSGVALVGTNPVYYKATVPERGQDATVTVKHEGNETVVLKSRASPKKNIWTSGPAVCQNRPNTWPRAEKGREQMTKRNQTRQGGAPRLNGRNATAKTTVVVGNPGKSNRKDGNPSTEPKGKVSTKVISVSKRFMEKHMKPKPQDAEVIPQQNSCEYCLVEADLEKYSSLSKSAKKPTTLKQAKPATISQNDPDCEHLDAETVGRNEKLRHEVMLNLNESIKSEYDENAQSLFEVKIKQKSDVTRVDYRAMADADYKGKSEMCNRTCSPEIRRKATAKSACVRRGTLSKSMIGTDPLVSRSLDLAKKTNWTHMMNPSTNPSERVKYFRQRLMKLYGNDACCVEERSGLPPLMVQALRPPLVASEKTTSQRDSAVKSVMKTSVSWRAASTKVRATTSHAKPVQRVVVHSAL